MIDRPTSCVAAGVDTWSVCWYLTPGSRAARTIASMAGPGVAGSQLLREPILDHRIGWFPDPGLLYAEGHPAPGGLARSEQLPAVLEQLRGELHDRGVQVPDWEQPLVMRPNGTRHPTEGFGGVRRLDSTVDLGFDDPLEGMAALTGVAALSLPRVQTQIWREVGTNRVRTVYYRGYGGKRVLARCYDKGVESRTAGPGFWVRPEDQRRFVSGARPMVEAVASGPFIRNAFVKRFEPLWQAAKGVKVGGISKLAKKLDELQREGEITPTAAKRIAGHLVLDAFGVQHQGRSTRCRDRADARRLGLVLADGVLDEVEVDLGEILERALDSDAWGQAG